MENLLTLLKNRRSTRKFTDQPLSPEETQQILEAALMSPAGKSKNPWHFIVVEDKLKLKQLSTAKEHGASVLAGAALAIVVVGDAVTSDTWVEDCSIASILMQLACEDLGLGSCWVQINKRLNAGGICSDDVVRAILDIPYTLEVLSIIGIGHKAAPRKPFDEEKLQWEKIHIDKW